MGVGEWLRSLGLGQYEPAFTESAIDFDVLPELTEDDLEKLGMLLGDRKRFIKAAASHYSKFNKHSGESGTAAMSATV